MVPSTLNDPMTTSITYMYKLQPCCDWYSRSWRSTHLCKLEDCVHVFINHSRPKCCCVYILRPLMQPLTNVSIFIRFLAALRSLEVQILRTEFNWLLSMLVWATCLQTTPYVIGFFPDVRTQNIDLEVFLPGQATFDPWVRQNPPTPVNNANKIDYFMKKCSRNSSFNEPTAFSCICSTCSFLLLCHQCNTFRSFQRLECATSLL